MGLLNSPLDSKDQTSQSWGKSTLTIHWKDWCWSWSASILATWCEEPTHWKILWCWERLRAGGEGGGRWWDGWMASPTQWRWVWANSRRQRRTGKPGMLQSMGSERVGLDRVTEQQCFVSYFPPRARTTLDSGETVKTGGKVKMTMERATSR